MGLVTDIKYETPFGKGDSKKITPESVLEMLRAVRNDIGSLNPPFVNRSLREVLEVVESGKYTVEGTLTKKIDLREPQAVIQVYRRQSGGGCRSCVSLGRETIDAQGATSGWYCEISDPDFNKNAVGDRHGCRYSGFSPKVKEHYDNPCGDWKPKFSKPLDKILEEAELIDGILVAVK